MPFEDLARAAVDIVNGQPLKRVASRSRSSRTCLPFTEIVSVWWKSCKTCWTMPPNSWETNPIRALKLVKAVKKDGKPIFYIKDNGIGIRARIP